MRVAKIRRMKTGRMKTGQIRMVRIGIIVILRLLIRQISGQTDRMMIQQQITEIRMTKRAREIHRAPKTRGKIWRKNRNGQIIWNGWRKGDCQ